MQYITRFLNDIREISNAKRGTNDLQTADIDLIEVPVNAIEMCRPTRELRKQHVSTAFPVAPLTVHADGVRLTQIFSNIIENVQKYSPLGTLVFVMVKVTVHEVEVLIRDQGVGIPPADRGRIFELYFQAKKKQGELGIGLAVARRYVEMHGASIVVSDNASDAGTTFAVTLPTPTHGTG